QIDGNFGGSAGIAEMLLQSHEGTIRLLPALTDEWSSGAFKGLCARGGFVVDAEWENGSVTALSVLAKNGGECTVTYPTKDGVTAARLRLGAGERTKII
ncbi:MAG: hypothetical protein K2N38_14880, partial [Oscillospiraceae bacterium]|nr:hypothetical protein [Oscillospiraceae bacterium]